MRKVRDPRMFRDRKLGSEYGSIYKAGPGLRSQHGQRFGDGVHSACGLHLCGCVVTQRGRQPQGGGMLGSKGKVPTTELNTAGGSVRRGLDISPEFMTREPSDTRARADAVHRWR